MNPDKERLTRLENDEILDKDTIVELRNKGYINARNNGSIAAAVYAGLTESGKKLLLK